jgi:Asp-tRNA(Asn)/Glu-tRNA(Gln) amidotransferase A subunit family amidase
VTTQRRAKTGTESGRVRRREVLQRVLALGVTTAVSGVGVEAQDETAAEITAADLIAADKLAGRAYTEKEHGLMLRGAGDLRKSYAVLQHADVDERVEPATKFDPRLPAMHLPTGRGSLHPVSAPTPTYDGNLESLAFAPVATLARLIRARKITSVELTRMYLDRLRKYGPRLNCVITLTDELALKQAGRADAELAAGRYRGPLHGIPWGAKDLLATRGIRTTWGAKPYEHQVLDYDATVVQRLDEAGAVLVAKLSMGELAVNDVWYGGMTRNPWNPKQGSSGSSAGPGSATAAGLVGFSIGSETLGSIVSPSVRCGVTGLRPTYGRVSRYGAMALCWTMDKLGPMCRGVEDCALVLSAIYGPDGKDGTVADVPFHWHPALPLRSLRVGINQAAFDGIGKTRPGPQSEAHKKVYAEALATLHKLGITPKPITLPQETEAYGALADLIIDVESAATFAQLTASGKLDLLAGQAAYSWPNTFRLGSTVPAVDYLQALRVRAQLQQAMATALHEVDCYVTVPFAGPTLTYTNLTGHPTLVTRCGMIDNVPQSIEFVGALYNEAAILRLGLAFEQATNWHTQWPDTTKLPLVPPPT